MERISIVTQINAGISLCFDLARDIDLHTRSMEHTGESAVAGKVSGLIGKGETVTFKARHFGVNHLHTSCVTAFDPPVHFRDVMVKGSFKRFSHDHHFEELDGGTLMVDLILFQSPYGPLGRIVDRFILRNYLERLIETRNRLLKAEAEGR